MKRWPWPCRRPRSRASLIPEWMGHSGPHRAWQRHVINESLLGKQLWLKTKCVWQNSEESHRDLHLPCPEPNQPDRIHENWISVKAGWWTEGPCTWPHRVWPSNLFLLYRWEADWIILVTRPLGCRTHTQLDRVGIEEEWDIHILL